MGAKEEQKLTKNDQFMKWLRKFGLKRNSPCEGKLMYKYVHRKKMFEIFTTWWSKTISYKKSVLVLILDEELKLREKFYQTQNYLEVN